MIDTKKIIEALLFSSEDPISIRRLREITNADARQIKKLIGQLKKEYEESDRAFSLEEVAKGYQILTRPEFSEWIKKFTKSDRKIKLSEQAFETLSIIAYKQPVTRAEVESIRGVQCGHTIRVLIDKGLVRTAGRSKEIGNAFLYKTTKKFLKFVGISSLKELPKKGEL